MGKSVQNGAEGSTHGSSDDSAEIVRRVVVSAKDAAVTETALVLSDAILGQLVIKGPLPPRV